MPTRCDCTRCIILAAADPLPAALGIFARPPREGRVKTRLIPDLGAALATEIYRHCLAHTLRVALDSGLACHLFLSESGDDPSFADFPVSLQQGGDLGERMASALSQLCRESDAGGIIIGSDCLYLDADYLRRAAAALASHDLVLAPAEDGGYALIGCRQPPAVLFEDIEWGGNRVLATTLARAEALKLRVCQLERVRDVDRLADVEHYPELRRLLTSR